MNSSEEESAAEDSETADREKAVKISQDGTTIQYVDLASQEEPTRRAILKIEILPSARILSMVEREQRYEVRAARAELWLTIAKIIVPVLGVVGFFTLGLTVGSLQKPSWLWQGLILVAFSGATGFGGYAIREAQERAHTRRSKDSDGLRQGTSDD